MADKEKYRYFAFIVYPESAPTDWWEQLRASHGSYARSPLHDPDDECTKPHYHVIYKHSNTVILDVAKRVIPSDVPCNGYVVPVPHPRGYQRYLVHLDDPEKQQWEGDPRELIETCNAFPLDLSRELSKAELQTIRADVIRIIRENGVTEYSDLLDGLLDSGMWDHFDYAFNHTIAFGKYVDSYRNKLSAMSLDRSGDESPDE